MRTTTKIPNPEELENIKDIREKSTEALKQEFDNRIKSEDGLRMNGSIYKLGRYTNKGDKEGSTGMIVYRKIGPDGQENVITTESNSSDIPENEEGNKIRNEYSNLKEEYVNLVLNHKPIEHYKKVIGENLWNTLTEDTKEIYKQQINYLENMVLAGKAIKIRVNPKMIHALQKMLGVHDFKGGAYRGTTIYLGHASDLFNEQMTRHEGIHVLQQKELGGFIPWLIEEAKEISQYKKENAGVNPNIKYDTTSKIPTEVEAYSKQLKENYISNRKEKAYLDKGQNQIESIEEGNYNLDKKAIKKGIENSNVFNLHNLYNDLKKLEESRKQGGGSEKTTLRIFNYLDKINDITRVIKVLEKKLEEKDVKIARVIKVLEKKLEEIPMNNGNSEELNEMIEQCKNEIANENVSYMLENDFVDPDLIKETIKNLEQKKTGNSEELNKMVEQCKNEIANENVSYMLENDFVDSDLIKETIKDLEQKSHDLRTEPTCIRLEEPEQVETWKSLTKEWEEEQKEKYGEKKWKKIKKEKENKEKGKGKDKLVVVVPPIYQNVKYTPTFMDK